MSADHERHHAAGMVFHRVAGFKAVCQKAVRNAERKVKGIHLFGFLVFMQGERYKILALLGYLKIQKLGKAVAGHRIVLSRDAHFAVLYRPDRRKQHRRGAFPHGGVAAPNAVFAIRAAIGPHLRAQQSDFHLGSIFLQADHTRISFSGVGSLLSFASGQPFPCRFQKVYPRAGCAY